MTEGIRNLVLLLPVSLPFFLSPVGLPPLTSFTFARGKKGIRKWYLPLSVTALLACSLPDLSESLS